MEHKLVRILGPSVFVGRIRKLAVGLRKWLKAMVRVPLCSSFEFWVSLAHLYQGSLSFTQRRYNSFTFLTVHTRLFIIALLGLQSCSFNSGWEFQNTLLILG